MRRPVIGISGNLTPIENDGVFHRNLRQYIHTDYTSSVEKAGGIPLLLPVSADPDVIRAHAAPLRCHHPLRRCGRGSGPLRGRRHPGPGVLHAGDRHL